MQDQTTTPPFYSFDAAAMEDPEFAADFAALETASRARGALDEKTRCLISLGICASIGFFDREAMRYYTQKAIAAGAENEEIQDTIRLTSVLGVHGYVHGVMTLLDIIDLEKVKEEGGAELAARSQKTRDHFEAKRGYLVEAWDKSSWLSPEFVSAYADYSSRPHLANRLPRKIRELIYIAIDFFPTMEAGAGGRGHMVQALENGATIGEILETLEVVALFGFKTASAALPILTEEKKK